VTQPEPKWVRCAEFATTYKALMLLCFVFFLALFVAAQLFPGNTQPREMVGVLCIFAGFSLLGLLTFCLILRMKIEWNDQFIRGANTFGQRRQLLWSEIQKVEYLEWAQAYRVTGKNGSTIWAYPMMAGFEDLRPSLDQYMPQLGPPPKLERRT
jgi:hypothetical protein